MVTKLKKSLAFLLAATFIITSIPLSDIMQVRAEEELIPEETVTLTLNMTLGEGVEVENYGFDYQIQKQDSADKGAVTTGTLTVAKSDVVVIKARTAGKVIYEDGVAMEEGLQAEWESGMTINMNDGDQTFDFELRNPDSGNQGGGNPDSGNQGGGNPTPPEENPKPPEVVDPEIITLTIEEGANLLEGYVLLDGQPVKDNQVKVGPATTHNIEFQVAFGSAVGQIFVNDVSYEITDLGMDKLQVTVPNATSYTIKLKEKQSDNLTIMWSYKDEDKDTDYYVENGKVELVSVVRNGEVVYDKTTESGNISINDEGGWVALKRGDNITIKLVPDYGYQVKSVEVNGVDTLQPQDSVSTFLLPNIQGNMHLKGMFVKQEDTINNSSEVFYDISLTNGEYAVNSGNIELNVEDTHEWDWVDLPSILRRGLRKVGTVDITLDNVVSKGNRQSGEAGNWTTNITEFDTPVTISVKTDNNELTDEQMYTVVRLHNGEFEEIRTDYDKETNEIKFQTNKFSVFFILKKNLRVSEINGLDIKVDKDKIKSFNIGDEIPAYGTKLGLHEIPFELPLSVDFAVNTNGVLSCGLGWYEYDENGKYTDYEGNKVNSGFITQGTKADNTTLYAYFLELKTDIDHIFGKDLDVNDGKDKHFVVEEVNPESGYARIRFDMGTLDDIKELKENYIPFHRHYYTGGYKYYDETYHWKLCTDKNCPAEDKGKTDIRKHSYDTEDEERYTCIECKYIDPVRKEEADKADHKHTYGNSWNYDGKSHWRLCSDKDCPYEDKGKKDEAGHVYDDLGNGTYKCESCDYSKTHEHTYTNNTYNKNNINHWLICDDPNCPAEDKGKKDEAVHVFKYIGNNNMGFGIYKCTICGYTCSHDHTYSDSKKSYDETNHWYECISSNCPDTNKGKQYVKPHNFIGTADDTYRCSFCAYKPDSHSGQPVESLTVKDITNSGLVSAKNPIKVGINTVTGTLEELLGISSSEKAQGVNVWLSSENITSTVSDTDKQLIAEKKGKGTVAMYLDLSLYKRVGTNEPSKVTELTGDLSVTVDLPEEIIKDNRTFSAVRVHNGVAEKLPIKLDTNKKTGTFQTTGFSTYAIVYEDHPTSTNTGSTSNTTNTSSSTTSTSSTSTSTSTSTNVASTTTTKDVPGTGDTANLVLWISVSLISIMTVIIIKKKELEVRG